MKLFQKIFCICIVQKYIIFFKFQDYDDYYVSVDDCKKIWRNMKDTYNKSRKVRKLGTGSSAINKLTKWALADELSIFMYLLMNDS